MNELQQAKFSLGTASEGKLGLALSGGGFRAALFHVGVLAQLADQDLLRHVAVISTVSGGSIIGAFYYLKLKQLLEGKRGDQLKPDAVGFRLLVRELEQEFLQAQQNNLRLITFADGRENARMLNDKISSTMRLANLFNEYFYTPITGDKDNLLSELSIRPAFDLVGEESAEFFVVPKLILNATALNTGHLFQFTADFVGEFPVAANMGGMGSMPLLKRLAPNDPALTPQQRMGLGQITVADAVAASCCVPGLLDPFSLRGLYTDEAGEEVVVRLVDGGVFDNQGLVSLYEDGCTHFVCSDASDLLSWQAKPDERIHNVAMRANEIMMDRIRNELLDELTKLGPENYVVFSLADPVDSSASIEEVRLAKVLRAIRTDLDAFSDLEAFALMDYGYRLSGEKLAGEAAKSDWAFSTVRELFDEEVERERLFLALEVGSHQFLKVFYLGKLLPYAIIVLPLIIPVVLLGVLIYFMPPIPTQAWAVLIAIAVIGITFSQNARIVERLDQVPAIKRFRRRMAVVLRPLGVTVALGMLGAGITWVNLRVFHPLFLKYGSHRKE